MTTFVAGGGRAFSADADPESSAVLVEYLKAFIDGLDL